MPRVVLAPRAVRDVAAATRWYDRQRLGLGDEFTTAVTDVVALLTRDPERFEIVHADLRRSPVERFPYALTFRVTGGTVRVVACTHHRRHPQRWQTRR